MAFRSANLERLVKFNSASSCDLVDRYQSFLQAQAAESASKPSARAFAPSSIRCKRKQWFRLRGTEPDILDRWDTALNYTAKLGTACHRILQNDLSAMFGQDWISVPDYLADNPIPFKYTLKADTESLETLISIENPPVRFACDGIVKLNNKIYLVEIKTCDFSSFRELCGPKPNHIDQVKGYCTLLGLSNVLFIYMDRQYGNIKVFEYSVNQSDKDNMLKMFIEITELADAGIAPDRIDWKDYECTNCKYKIKCKQWG